MLPGILNQLGAESFSSLKKLASTVAGKSLSNFIYIQGMLHGKKRNVNEIAIDKWMLIGLCLKMSPIV